MKGIVDLYEGDYTVIEIDVQTHDVAKSIVDASVKVGEVVTFVNGVWKANIKETEQREQHIKKLMNDVWED
ncbi:DUF3006 domain-containing protein [Paenibacillus sp. An7]|uniref:DUF3006 domain-containing protein n=1 Tax=Paenibacillus sp. An7 TaxID=2689577 RepID=UPI001357608F|nr:DUF3006 domain-containing protein [Paenibacillus sp. An7]